MHRLSWICIILFSWIFTANSQVNKEKQAVFDINYYPDSLQTSQDIIAKCTLDVYYSELSKDNVTIIYIHGGWLKGGDKIELPKELLDTGLNIVSVNYRLSPKVKAPLYIEDVAAAIAWTFKNVKDYGGDEEKIFLMGYSAGGYLASLVGLDKKWLSNYGINTNQLAGLFILSGQMVTHSTIIEEMGYPDNKILIDEYAPLNHITNNAPPLILFTGDRIMDIPGRYEENLFLKNMMEVSGHNYTKLFELQGYGHSNVVPAIPLIMNEVQSIINHEK
ncbi:alpha/beta hydrolase [Christiangramia sp.]|uniref:alpha/beta hydrolase n=1 Tax=Christiangramia sp. TaxID=1931228 RepID=UPI002622249F|nr:alpha/beta hydrolase [Christiangramia sp.]